MKIIVAEDNDLLRKLIVDCLAHHFPTDDVLPFSNGATLVESVDRNRVDIAVLDIHLPGKNGFKISHVIRQKYPDAMIIIYTNYDIPEYRENARAFGADFFLSKENSRPADLAQLIKTDIGMA